MAPDENMYKVRTVVIDAGHGGKDPGAVSGGVLEKDIALSIALKTGAYIQENLPDVKVIYTRKDDNFVELHRRAGIANEAQADLFISIHCNANRSSKPYGTETYVMGLHKSQANLEVAKKENAAILLEEDYESEYEGYDPNLPENTIIFSLFQNAHLNQSLVMASMVEDQFRERVKRHDRGVKQAGFLVLYRTTMPGVLIETGFLTNPAERKFLNTEQGQAYIASAIYRAFKNYKEIQEEENNRVSDAFAEVVAENINIEDSETIQEVVEEILTPPAAEIYFSIQFLSSKHEKSLDAVEFRGISDLRMYQHMGLYKYTSGEFATFEQAQQHRNNVIAKGFKDAFVVAFRNGERIKTSEARAMTGR
ncbi:MAG: N-acetylmuramoyl-L-alanine amidase [Marinilabiliales bacterium]|nr:MAG: N-acetylmuramoyl-L-alanine amidase [Marinilabiliales bacterium]